DNDGNLEVIICVNDGTLIAVKHNGSLASGFPLYYGTPWLMSPVMADIDGNNQLDMLVANSHNLYYLAIKFPYIESSYPVHAFSRTRNSVYSFDFVSENDLTQSEKRKIELYANYPNPFNPITRIRFEINDVSFKIARLEIFNIKGQKISDRVLNDLDIKNGFIEWDADNQPSGIYFYRLSIDGQNIDIKKAVLLK
ncbi:MAG: T9SS type A sorting domain-containing protein, partial [Candidatus Cloacimonetes bacterium]|nr:T9SS type A sorting domain-containing protein [Candidatus Cloacimonadota bacterium]